MVDIPSELSEVAARIRRHLTRARADRHHPMRLAWIATIGLDGAAKSRMAVIRRSQFAPFTITLFTDTRARKWRKSAPTPAVAWACSTARRWNKSALAEPGAGIPIRPLPAPIGRGKTRPRAPFTPAQPPGEPIARQASDRDHDGFANFGVLELAVDEIDWLLLGRDRHYRAIFHCTADPWTGQWVNP